MTGTTPNYMLYYSATTTTRTATPYPINGYQLLTSGSSGPISSTYLSTTTLFCDKSPTPSVSSNTTTAGTGIVWAIENQNGNNPNPGNCDDTTQYLPAALHAFNATNLAAPELYGSRNLQTKIGPATSFTPPTIFKGQVYVGTSKEVAVFGLCATLPSRMCLP